MTSRGSRGFGSAVTLLGILVCALLLWRGSCDDASAQTTYVTGDWGISNETVSLENESVDVMGNVTIGEGGRLVLVNSSLAMNCSRSGQDILVDRGGSLRSVDSCLRGGYTDSFLTVRGDMVLVGTTVQSFSGRSQMPGLQMEDGTVEVRDSRIHCVMQARTDILLVNASVRYLQLIHRHPSVERDLTWVVRDLDPGSGGFYISIESSNGPVISVDALIENMPFFDLDYGMDIILDRGLDVMVSNCTFIRTKYNINVVETEGGTAEFTNNTIVGNDMAIGSTGFWMRVTGRSALSFRNNTVTKVDAAYTLVTREGPHVEYSIGDLRATECRYSLSVWSEDTGGNDRFHVTLGNSTFEDIEYGFYVGTGSGLTIYDSMFGPGSGFVRNDGEYLRAYTLVDISSVGWRGGPPIVSGRLLLLGNGSAVVASMDMGALEPVLLMAWEHTPRTRTYHEVLTPSIHLDGCCFNGTPFDPWEQAPVDLEIIDDRPPLLSIDFPSMGTVYNRDRLTAKGTCVERGHGLASLTYTLDDSFPASVSDIGDGSWSLQLHGLQEGESVLSLHASDRAGNEAVLAMVIFGIDTTVPILEVLEPQDIMNTSELVVSGRTEPRSSLMVNGFERSIEADGSFAVTLTLVEGSNHISISVKDRAGNHNVTAFEVRLDTTPPYLLVECPWNGTWVTAWEVLVRGETEPGAHIEVDGEEVELMGGAFEHVALLPFGEHRMSIDVRDRAGNVNHRVIVLFADWESPRLSVESPNRTTVYTNGATVFILGTVEDEFIDVVSVNGEPVTVREGTFLRECGLEVGRNVFEVTAADLAGNENRLTFTVIVDVEHPECSCEVEAVDCDLTTIGHTLYSPTPRFRLSVVASEHVFVTVAQRRYGPSTRLLIALALDEGRNDLVAVVSDRAGNEAILFAYEVVVDTVPPELTVTTSLIGDRTEDGSLTVYGVTEAGVRLTVDGVRCSVRYDGTFDEDLSLEVGMNEIVVTVTDLAGNTNSETLTVKRVESEPDFRTAVVGLGLLVISAVVMLGLLGMSYLRTTGDDKVT